MGSNRKKEEPEKQDYGMMPQNLDAEKAFVGACLIDPEKVFEKCLAKMSHQDFYYSFHADVCRAMLDLHPKNPVNIISVANWLKVNCTDKSYDLGQLTMLIDSCPTVSSCEHYLDIVRDLSYRRRLIYQFEILSQKLKNEPDANISEVLDKNMTDTFEVYNQIICGTGSQDNTIGPEIGKLYDLMELNPNGIATKNRVKTGFSDFDNYYGGLTNGCLTYFGGRPSHGKTTITVQMALHIAETYKKPVYYFSFEVPEDELLKKIMAFRGNLPGNVINEGFIGEKEMIKAAQVCGDLSGVPFCYMDKPCTVQEVYIRARKIKMMCGGLSAIFVDRLEFFTDPQNSNETENNYIARKSNALNLIARELNVPVVCLVQLNREVTKRKGKNEKFRPRDGDLRGSGSIEQDAKMILFIHRPEKYEPTPENFGKAELIVAKNSFGPTGMVNLYFDKDIPAFYNVFDEKEND